MFSFLLVLNLTAAIGALIGGAAADRWRAKRVIGTSYILVALSIALLSIKSSLVITYVLVAPRGLGLLALP